MNITLQRLFVYWGWGVWRLVFVSIKITTLPAPDVLARFGGTTNYDPAWGVFYFINVYVGFVEIAKTT